MNSDVVFVLDSPVGADPVTVDACHQVMANASAMFRVMLDGSKFKEGEQLHSTGRCEIPLVETNADAFQILCKIFHLHGDTVPLNVGVELLHEIVKLVDRYDCLPAIQPWPRIWRQENNELFSSYSSPIASAELPSVLRMIHISSILHYEDVFTNSCAYLLNNVKGTNFSEPSIECLYNDLTPNVQNFIFARLDTFRQGMKKLAHDTIASLEAGGGCKDSRTLDPVNRFNCSSMLLGNALLGMRSAFGADWLKGDQWERMPVELYEPMLKFAQAMNGPRWLRTRDDILRGHVDCGLDKVLGRQIKFLHHTACKPPTLVELKTSSATKPSESDWETVLYQLLHTGCVMSDEDI